jgi:hypothetical protein
VKLSDKAKLKLYSLFIPFYLFVIIAVIVVGIAWSLNPSPMP